MKEAPSFDDIFAVMAAASVGDSTARVPLGDGPKDDLAARFAIALNVLLDDHAHRAEGRRAVMSSLRASEERYRLMFEKNPMPMWVHDTVTLRFLAVNGALVLHYGYSQDELLTLTVTALTAEPPVDGAYAQQVSKHRKKDGSLIDVETRAHDIYLDGRPARLVLANDVTQRRRLEEQLRQSQKMEAIGRLAGGVAHDFNNILSVILGYSDTALLDLPGDAPIREEITEIRRAAARAADLTRQLLMFSRQQVLEPKILDVNDVLADMDKMLRRIVGADVELVMHAANDLGTVRADRGSLEQVVMNLAVNARDAMPTGGKLTMATANVSPEEALQVGVGVGAGTAGSQVMLAVTDSGIGMDAATAARVFEPFFTTKGLGKGTGLGLSTVFGIVEQSGGSIQLFSEPGKGSTFKIYLPRVTGTAPAGARGSVSPPRASRGVETILLVEDDEQVRGVAHKILEMNGYRVIVAGSAREAIAASERHPEVIDLLLSDVVMPLMSGPELAKRLVLARPDLKVLCMSGYTDDSVMRHGVFEAKIAFLQKPITPLVLAAKVREVLDSKVGAT
jgi:PAS domain S-box-containing protein